MSDRIIINQIECCYCKKVNKNIFYNDEWANSFECIICGEENFIFPAYKTYKKVNNEKIKKNKEE